MGKKVVIGLSGGVDSSVAAWMLKREGYSVSALFMKNWSDTTGLLRSECHWEDDIMFAEMVARKLDIPFHHTDLSDQYRKRVVDYMFAEYERGRTPNPDILCNREIKFDSFAEAAFDLGADLLATGHYCRKDVVTKDGTPVYRLLAGTDQNKDQSYFLCQITPDQLSRALFPIGGLTKYRVREIARELDLPTANRKDSQGICFIGKVDLPTFLQQKLHSVEGEIIEIEREKEIHPNFNGLPPAEAPDELLDALTKPFSYTRDMGRPAGKHRGAHFFTVGQRKGLNVGGRKEPLFVIGTDTKENIVYTGEGHSHSGLNRKGLSVRESDIHYIRPDKAIYPGETADMLVRIRHRQELQKARLYRRERKLYILFEEMQRGITAGQFAAWYDGEELIGSAVIDG